MINEQEMDGRMMTLKIIWSAMLMSLAVYLAVGRMVAPNIPSTIGSEAFATLRIALYLLGFATLIASSYVKRLIMAGRGQRGDPLPARPASVMQKYTSAVIVSLAMSESVGIYGLVLFLLGRNETDLYLLLGISAAAMVYYRPKKDELAGLSQEQP